MPKWVNLIINKFMENEVIQIWASSKKLNEKLTKQYPEKVIYIPNGVEISKFKNEKPPKGENITIGYIGIISSWFFDFNLIKLIAETFPNITIRLIGPIDPLADKLIYKIKNIPNISLEGKVDYNLIPKLITSFDIGIIPLIQSNKVFQLNSAKFLQYLASGIPIVSVPFYEFEEFNDDVFFCKSNNDFLNSINKIINNKSFNYKNIKKIGNWDWDNIIQKVRIQINTNLSNF